LLQVGTSTAEWHSPQNDLVNVCQIRPPACTGLPVRLCLHSSVVVVIPACLFVQGWCQAWHVCHLPVRWQWVVCCWLGADTTARLVSRVAAVLVSYVCHLPVRWWKEHPRLDSLTPQTRSCADTPACPMFARLQCQAADGVCAVFRWYQGHPTLTHVCTTACAMLAPWCAAATARSVPRAAAVLRPHMARMLSIGGIKDNPLTQYCMLDVGPMVLLQLRTVFYVLLQCWGHTWRVCHLPVGRLQG
jgi:hypothetical protein